jgi:hypothetical protein
MSNTQVIAVENLEDWFRQSIGGALQRRQVSAQPHTAHYMVRLVTAFARTDKLYETVGEGSRGLKPLACLLAEAFEAVSIEKRQQMLQRLGDLALFVAGFFSDYLNYRPVDVDYYSRLGGTAYGMLAELPARSQRDAILTEVFAELARKFTEFVDVLNELAQQARTFGQRDLLRLYELWLRTGSRRMADKLRELGVHPAAGARTRFIH